MRRNALIAFGVLTAALLSAVALSSLVPTRDEAGNRERVSVVVRGPLEVWAHYTGELQADGALLISAMPGAGGALIELLPEGSTVQAGDVLARFDATELEQQVIRLEQELALALADLEGLEKATLPVERAALESAALAARNAWRREEGFMKEAQALLQDGLMSAGELQALKETLAELRGEAENLEREVDLTVRFLHPSRLRHQQAKVDAATRALQLAAGQLAGAQIRAPVAGVVLHRMLQIGTEFRTARVGDMLPANQPFMMLPDMKRLVVHCNVAESELANVQPGSTANITPVAFPGLTLTGSVARVGAMAQNVPGRPSWQRFFPVIIAINEQVTELRPGMTVNVDVLGYRNDQAILVERAAVRWEAGVAVGEFDALFAPETRPLVLGRSDPRHFEVLQGAEPGDRVFLP